MLPSTFLLEEFSFVKQCGGIEGRLIMSWNAKESGRKLKGHVMKINMESMDQDSKAKFFSFLLFYSTSLKCKCNFLVTCSGFSQEMGLAEMR